MKWSEIFFDNFQTISWKYSTKFSKIIFEIFWYFSRILYKLCFENFLENLFLNIYHADFKLKYLCVTVRYKCNRSNTENIECRPVMSLLQLNLTNEHIMSSNHLEWRMPHHTSFPHSMNCPTTPPPPCLTPIYFHCIFRYSPVFWPGTLCSDFKYVSHQKVEWKGPEKGRRTFFSHQLTSVGTCGSERAWGSHVGLAFMLVYTFLHWRADLSWAGSTCLGWAHTRMYSRL